MGVDNFFAAIPIRKPVATEDPRKKLKAIQGKLEFTPDVSEIEEALLRGEPLGGADGAFGESLSGFGIVTQVNSIGRRIEDQLVHADSVAFAEGDDLKFLLA